MAAAIPMLVGGVAAYAQKKTEKLYFFEQSMAGAVGYTIGLARILAKDSTYITNRHAATVLAVPALISGMGWGVGRITGRLVGDAMN